ncbi:MAG TPA: sugar/pyridoxal phosphate phosphatase YigL, partial [Alphaproteobacteria bacterium]|nr:sugar/pyridoxal phosphate phosphatase YigL [Alphaproteobacteria bacterium]
MSFKLIVSDIDGTFLNSKKQISPATIDVCRKLYFEKGVRFALASGRGRAGIR